MPENKAREKRHRAPVRKPAPVKNVRIRFDADAHALIAEVAKVTGRSFNSFVVWATKKVAEAEQASASHGN